MAEEYPLDTPEQAARARAEGQTVALGLSETSPSWCLSWRADPIAREIADRHYNRQKIGAKQFVPPGSCLVLLSRYKDALWVTSAPIAEYVQHEWAGAWMCSCFRNEGPSLSSELIREAVAITRWKYGEPPAQGFVTFVDRAKTRSKRDPGYCYLKAGWESIGRTKGGLHALGLGAEQLLAVEPLRPIGAQMELELTDLASVPNPQQPVPYWMTEEVA